VQAVDRLGGDLHRGVEAERHLGAAQVVVDRLGHADAGHVELGEAVGDPQGVVTADRHDRLDLHLVEHLGRALAATGLFEGVRARGPENGAAAGEQVLALRRLEGHRATVEDPAPPVEEADELVPGPGPGEHDGTDDGVQPRAVTTTGQDAHSHCAHVGTATTAGHFGAQSPGREPRSAARSSSKTPTRLRTISRSAGTRPPMPAVAR